MYSVEVYNSNSQKAAIDVCGVLWLGSPALMRMKTVCMHVMVVISVGSGLKPTQVGNLGFFYGTSSSLSVCLPV